MAKSKREDLNGKYIVVGHDINGKIVGHPILGIQAGKVLTKQEFIDKYYLPLNMQGLLVETYQDRFAPGEYFCCYEAFEKDVEDGFFAKIG